MTDPLQNGTGRIFFLNESQVAGLVQTGMHSTENVDPVYQICVINMI